MTQSFIDDTRKPASATLGRKADPVHSSARSVPEPGELTVLGDVRAWDRDPFPREELMTFTAPKLMLGTPLRVHYGLGSGASLEAFGLQHLLSTFGADRELLVELLEDEPVEPGGSNPAEGPFERLASDPASTTWLSSLYDERPELRRSLLLCIGRLGTLPPNTSFALQRLVRLSLTDTALEVREAGVRATETLGAIGRQLLTTYTEPVAWLRDYANRVLRRLK